MSCSSPMYAIKLYENDKVHLKFCSKNRVDYDYNSLCQQFGSDNVLILPCGHCDNCLEQRAKSWAVRCVLEASCYSDNCFITLTYNTACLPKHGLSKRDLQNFIKRLRSRYPDKTIRYFACGEYGLKDPDFPRAHYHILIFNWFPEDAKPLVHNSDPEHTYYSSKILSKLWTFGFVTCGFLNFTNCAYVARYCHKKVGKDFLSYNGLNKEFTLMSLKPGLGLQFFSEDIYDTDKIYFPFSDKVHHAAPSRYFDKLLDRLDPGKLEAIKDARVSNANLALASELLSHSFCYREELDHYHGEIKKDKMQKLVRKDI